jgi:hypothetical protein
VNLKLCPACYALLAPALQSTQQDAPVFLVSVVRVLSKCPACNGWCRVVRQHMHYVRETPEHFQWPSSWSPI